MAQRKSKGKTAEVKTIKQYCSVCNKTFDMPIVEKTDDVIWLICPGCKGYLPYMLDKDRVDRTSSDSSEKAVQIDDGDLAPEDIDKDNAREYRENEEYDIGEIIYHRSWNDYGKVISKETLPGNRKTIVVRFINQGKIRLLEGMAP
ncbi:hypothetical protein DRQ05_04185 [bacterium]|nr:MAG: hypothetical protein DRQ05_04185 [bacterium]